MHMLTVVLGILIALSLDGLLEWNHHRQLVREARENITTEIRKNKEDLDQALSELQKRQDDLKHIIDLMHQIESNPGSFKQGATNYSWSNHNLYSTAWKTAVTSGAVNYMKYDELTVQRRVRRPTGFLFTPGSGF